MILPGTVKRGASAAWFSHVAKRSLDEMEITAIFNKAADAGVEEAGERRRDEDGDATTRRERTQHARTSGCRE